jgi:hypothetical protein
MKTLIASFLALLLGLVAGWYFERQHAERKMTDVVEQMQQPVESGDREHAARAVRAIQMIESGDSSNAVRLLSRPIVDYYQFHANLTHNDKLTRDVLALIEQLASTNTQIADEIHAKIQ